MKVKWTENAVAKEFIVVVVLSDVMHRPGFQALSPSICSPPDFTRPRSLFLYCVVQYDRR